MPSAVGEELPSSNLTQEDECGYVCPFNEDSMEHVRYQPCFYTVLVSEVFKGSYSVS